MPTMTTKKKANGTVPAATAPKVEFPRAEMFKMVGDKALTVEKAKEYLGWTVTTSAKESHLTDFLGNRILLTHNAHGRSIRSKWLEELAQMILFRPPGHDECQWKFNWQPIQIGKYGNVVSGRHRMCALVLADEMRLHPMHAEYHKSRGWKRACTIETLLVEGVEEDITFSRTADHTEPMTDADILYIGDSFAGVPSQEREKLCRIAGNAIKILWDRTGRGSDTHTSICTPTELDEFVKAHPGLQDMVRESVNTNGAGQAGNKLSIYLPLGYCAAFSYLMAASTSDPEAYRAARCEDALSFDAELPTGDTNTKGKPILETIWERARGFFIGLSGPTDRVSALQKFINKRRLDVIAAGGTDISPDERCSAVIKAWRKFMHLSSIGKLTLNDVRPNYTVDPDNDQVLVLDEFPRISDGEGSGIDFGSSKQKDSPHNTDQPPEPGDPEPEVVAEEAEAIRGEHVNGNGGAVVEESPSEERARRETIENGNGKHVMTREEIGLPMPSGKPKASGGLRPRTVSPSPEEANRAAVGRKPGTKSVGSLLP